MSFKITKESLRGFLLMLLSVCFMGFSLSLLVLTNLGTDPCSAMNYGISSHLGISFGTYQVLMNLVLLIIVLLCKRSLIGWGTLGNMIIVGYTADFFSWFWHQVCHIPAYLPLQIRLAILIPGLFLFVISAACYMHSGQGMAPYDAIPFILSEKLEEKTRKNPFRIVRLCQDLLCTLIGVATGGTAGLMTFLMVLTLGPVVQFVGDLFKKNQSTDNT